MTTYYVLPALTALDSDMGVYSNVLSLTSGGSPLVSVTPGSGDIVVFDSNSGSSRTVTVDGFYGGSDPDYDTFLVKTGAPNITFSGNVRARFVTFQSGVSATVTGTVYCSQSLTLQSGVSVSGNVSMDDGNGSSYGVTSITSNGAYIPYLYPPSGNYGTLSINDDLYCGNILWSSSYALTFNSNDHNIAVGQWSPANGTFNLGNSTITVYASTGNILWLSNSSITVTGNPTFKLAGTLSNAGGTPYVEDSFFNGSCNLDVATTGVPLRLGTQTSGGPYTKSMKKLTLRKGSSVQIHTSYTMQVTDIVADATGDSISIASTSSTVQTKIKKTTAGPCYMDRVQITGVNFDTSAGASYYDRLGIDGGLNSNVTFTSGNSTFMSFF